MMDVSKAYSSLCNPAKFYFIISMVSFVIILLQNMGNRSGFTLGALSTSSASPALVLTMHVIFVLIWTWMLNMLCRINPKISWVIVLFPFVLMFIAYAMMLFSGGK
jgi:hypothetical protein